MSWRYLFVVKKLPLFASERRVFECSIFSFFCDASLIYTLNVSQKESKMSARCVNCLMERQIWVWHLQLILFHRILKLTARLPRPSQHWAPRITRNTLKYRLITKLNCCICFTLFCLHAAPQHPTIQVRNDIFPLCQVGDKGYKLL